MLDAFSLQLIPSPELPTFLSDTARQVVVFVIQNET